MGVKRQARERKKTSTSAKKTGKWMQEIQTRRSKKTRK